MFKNFKKKLMILISAVLVFTMIPSVAFAEDASSISASDYFSELTENKVLTPDKEVSKYVVYNDGTEYKDARGYGALSCSIKVKGNDTYDLEITLPSTSRNISKLTIDGVEYTPVAGSAYTFIINNFDPELIVASNAKDGFSHSLKIGVTATKTADSSDDSKSEAWIFFNLTGETAGGKEEESTSRVGVTIIRTGNFSPESTNTEYNRGYKVVSYDSETGIAKVELTGEFTKQFMGTYTDAQNASDSQLTSLTPVDGKTTVEIPVSALDTAIKVSLKQVGMGAKWREYSFTFYKKEIKPTDVEETDTALVVDAKEETVVAVSVAQLVNATKPLEIQTKLGTVSFDTKALAGFVAANTDNITFEINDLKDQPIYKNSKYDMVLDLSLTDDEGNPIFTEGQGGKATITVPYEKEVPAGQKVVVYYIGLTGKEAVEATYDANAKTVTFTVEHFSTYAITQEAVTPSTGDNSMTVVTISLIALAVAAAGVTSAVVYKKKAADR